MTGSLCDAVCLKPHQTNTHMWTPLCQCCGGSGEEHILNRAFTNTLLQCRARMLFMTQETTVGTCWVRMNGDCADTHAASKTTPWAQNTTTADTLPGPDGGHWAYAYARVCICSRSACACTPSISQWLRKAHIMFITVSKTPLVALCTLGQHSSDLLPPAIGHTASLRCTAGSGWTFKWVIDVNEDSLYWTGMTHSWSAQMRDNLKHKGWIHTLCTIQHAPHKALHHSLNSAE